MGFHFEDGGEPIADIHGSGILSRSLDHPLPFGGKALQMDPGTFVGTMLAPHHRKNPEFRQIGLTTQMFEDLLKFFLRQAMPLNHLGRHVSWYVLHKN